MRLGDQNSPCYSLPFSLLIFPIFVECKEKISACKKFEVYIVSLVLLRTFYLRTLTIKTPSVAMLLAMDTRAVMGRADRFSR